MEDFDFQFDLQNTLENIETILDDMNARDFERTKNIGKLVEQMQLTLEIIADNQKVENKDVEKDKYSNKYQRIYDFLAKTDTLIKSVVKELLKEDEFVKFVRNVFDYNGIKNKSVTEAAAEMSDWLPNGTRGYILKMLAFKFLYQKMFDNKWAFLDGDLPDKLDKKLKNKE